MSKPSVLAMPSTRLHFNIFLHIYNALLLHLQWILHCNVIYWTQWCNFGITQLLFLWIADLREIYAKLFRKNYKLFLWIADLREIYAKLFRKRITNYFYGLQISGKYMPNCSQMWETEHTKTQMQTNAMDRKLKEQTPIISDSHKITCWGHPKQPNAS